MTAVLLALFNAGAHRLRMLECVVRHLRHQQKKVHLSLGLLEEEGAKLSPYLNTHLDQTFFVQGSSELFQKEAIWNFQAKNLPPAIQNLVFLDADIFPLDTDWVGKIEEGLEKYEMLQGFSTLYYLPKTSTLQLLETPSFNFTHDDLLKGKALVLNKRHEHTEEVAVAYPSYAFTHRVGSRIHGASGGCLIFRRSYFEKMGGFPYEEVFGGVNDILLFHKLNLPTKWDPTLFAATLRKKFFSQNTPSPSLSFVPRRLYHLFHKSGAERNYHKRVVIAKDWSYDPEMDIRLNETGGISLTETGLRLKAPLQKISEEILKPDL